MRRTSGMDTAASRPSRSSTDSPLSSGTIREGMEFGSALTGAQVFNPPDEGVGQLIVGERVAGPLELAHEFHERILNLERFESLEAGVAFLQVPFQRCRFLLARRAEPKPLQ